MGKTAFRRPQKTTEGKWLETSEWMRETERKREKRRERDRERLGMEARWKDQGTDKIKPVRD